MSDGLPYLERVKIQAEILLPLYRLMKAELGAQTTARLIRAAVADYAAQVGKSLRAEGDGNSLTKLKKMIPVFTAGNALDVEMVSDTETDLTFNVRGCRYAEYFKALGEPELGAMLTCEIDPPLTAGIGDDLGLERSQTILKGGTHCDFKWAMKR
jgi:hypothetical protein